MTRHAHHHKAEFSGAHGGRLAADVWGEAGSPVLLLHGGGQTRHAWDKTADRLAQAGHIAISLDQRGHGQSDWDAPGRYNFRDYAADAACVADQIAAQYGDRPAVVGASLGGISALHAQGSADAAGRVLFSALVLVDVTPRMDPQGVDKVQGFMRLHAQEGFASVEEAADAVAAYLPHRPRPTSTAGLAKNLRKHEDGRWRWHWDPRFLDGPSPVDGERTGVQAELLAAAAGLTIPTLLVRGGSSELVGEEHANEFLSLAKHAKFVDVAGAHHMVAGDRNDVFAGAILGFLAEVSPA